LLSTHGDVPVFGFNKAEKLATLIQMLFQNIYLTQCAFPLLNFFRKGDEYTLDCNLMREYRDSKVIPATSHNLQANAIIEEVHNVVV
jgi:hypothetical protein